MTLELPLEQTCAIDDARQPIGEHTEYGRHSGQQEHRSDRRLDQMDDVYHVTPLILLAPLVLLSPAGPRAPAGCGLFVPQLPGARRAPGPRAAAAAIAGAALLAVRSFNKVFPCLDALRCTPLRSAVSPTLRPPTRTRTACPHGSIATRSSSSASARPSSAAAGSSRAI